jgi:hypothetical protein
MKTFKKYMWTALALCALIVFSILGINQVRYKEWEKLQPDIKISAEEAIHAIEKAGLQIENIEDTTIEVRKARYRFGDPLSAFEFNLVKEKIYSVLIVEYRDWRDAQHQIDYINSYLGSDTPQNGLFSHGTVAILCYPPDENIKTQLKRILMEVSESSGFPGIIE